jgi:hypothetical protein
MKPSLVNDELWKRLEPLLPKPRRKSRHIQLKFTIHIQTFLFHTSVVSQ